MKNLILYKFYSFSKTEAWETVLVYTQTTNRIQEMSILNLSITVKVAQQIDHPTEVVFLSLSKP